MSDKDFPTSGLVRLIYASRSNLPMGDESEAIRGILIKSISNNRMVDVTGQLIIWNDLFMQLLEGPAVKVAATYERVVRDPRHSDVRLLSVGEAPKRLFRDWHMSERRISGMAPPLESITAEDALSLLAAGSLTLAS